MRWIPLEANPDVINNFMSKLGVDKAWQCVDVYGTENDILEYIPKPVVSLLLLFPLTEAVKNRPIGEIRKDTDLIFIKQTIGNACGTMGLLHSLCNNRDTIGLAGDSYINTLSDKLIPLNPNERAIAIESEEFLSVAHEQVAMEGQTETREISDYSRVNRWVSGHQSPGQIPPHA